MLIIEKIRNCEKRKKYAFVFWMAVFYYLAYLLDTPAFDYRVLDFVMMGRSPQMGAFGRPKAEDEEI